MEKDYSHAHDAPYPTTPYQTGPSQSYTESSLYQASPPDYSNFQDEVGSFNGGNFRISHRDCNSVLTIQLSMGCPILARRGAMIAMSTSISVKGAVSMSLKKFIAGTPAKTIFTGPGELILAPNFFGDVTVLTLTGTETWYIGKDSFLASTQGIQKDLKRQSLGKAMFSGEGLFVFNVTGSGTIWITSTGAILRKCLQPGEEYIIDNGHLVAWNCPYQIEHGTSGGIMSGISTGEGLVCKFRGPGLIFFQSRNLINLVTTINTYGQT